MARNSKFSKQNYLAASSLKPKKISRDVSLADQIMETKLRSEQAKLKLLEADLPDEDVNMRYEDFPPPSPEDEAEFHGRLRKLVYEIAAEPIGPDEGQSVQEWLVEQGATIPDSPDWTAPLYIDKWVMVAAS